jgi:hypothetical protein
VHIGVPGVVAIKFSTFGALFTADHLFLCKRGIKAVLITVRFISDFKYCMRIFTVNNVSKFHRDRLKNLSQIVQNG